VSEEEQTVPAEQKPDAGKPEKEKQAQHKPVTHRKKKQHGHKATGGMWLLVPVVIIAAGWYGYDYVKQIKQSVKNLADEQYTIKQQRTELRGEFESKWNILKKQQDDLTDNINTLREKNLYLRKDWLLLEAEYLIQLANQRILLERDVKTAIAALESADMRLRDTGDPGIVKVRQVINQAIQSLKQVPQSDIAGMSLTLSSINNDLEKLPLATPDPKSREQQVQRELEETQKVESWRELPAAVWRDLKNLVVIRDHEKPVKPLLSPEQRFFLMENLRLQIEQARLALLSGQQTIYKERLDTAVQWIGQYFDKESSVTKSTLQSLQQLSVVMIAPELPDISNTYVALQHYVAGKQQNDKAKPPAVNNQNTQQAQ
jgi:uroporphyrin-3 C-methyltransferase